MPPARIIQHVLFFVVGIIFVFLVGPDALFVDEVEQDESTQALQSQASMTIADPDSGEPIGAITIGINLDQL